MMMNNLKWAIAAGAIALSFGALPAEAATVLKTNTKNNGLETIDPAAYRIEDLLVAGDLYNVSFKFGDFNTVYAGNPAPFADDFADILGTSILSALSGQASQVISDVSGFTSGGTFETFFIPKSPDGLNPGQDVFLECFTANNSGCPLRDRADSQRSNDQVIYATYALSTSGGGTAIPTPALLPGLLGMGAAVLRRKKQAAEEIAA